MSQTKTLTIDKQRLLQTPPYDDELGLEYANEAKIRRLEEQLVTWKMQVYYVWILLYIIFSINSSYHITFGFFEVSKPIVKYAVYMKAFTDGMAVLACLLLYIGFFRKSCGMIKSAYLIFTFINLPGTVVFYVIVTLCHDFSWIIFIGIAGAAAFLNTLPARYMKGIMEKRDSLNPENFI